MKKQQTPATNGMTIEELIAQIQKEYAEKIAPITQKMLSGEIKVEVEEDEDEWEEEDEEDEE